LGAAMDIESSQTGGMAETASVAWTPAPSELAHYTALQQAALVRTRAVSAEELTRSTLATIAELNPVVSAFVVRTGATRDSRRSPECPSGSRT